MAKRKNTPRVSAPDRARRAVAHPPSGSTSSMHPVFSFRYADKALEHCPWGYHRNAGESHEVSDILCTMGRLTWAEIERQEHGNSGKRHRKHHDQPISSLCKEARERIAQLRLDQVMPENIFRFRHGGTGRLWGFRVQETFHVLWWDPDHKVYPTEP